MKNILITGGAGYIGSHTCLTLLEKGYKVTSIDSNVNSSPLSLKFIKNWLLALSGFWLRAAPIVPRSCGIPENSAFKSGSSEPPVPAERKEKSFSMFPFLTSPV